MSDVGDLNDFSLPPLVASSSRPRSVRSVGSAGSASQSGPKTLAELRVSCRDGRACALCLLKDSSPDFVNKDEPIYWQYPPRNYRNFKDATSKDDFRPEGRMDIYCGKVYKYIFQPTFAKPEALRAEFGVNPETHDLFKALIMISYASYSKGLTADVADPKDSFQFTSDGWL